MDGLLVQDEGDVRRITFDRPDRLNALTTEVLDAASDAVESANSARVIVLSGSGRAFCAGADVSGDMVPSVSTLESANRLVRVLLQSPRPSIAAVNGVAAGVGVSIALACDLVVAREAASFMLAFTRIGLMPDGGASLLVAAAVGRARAMRMALLAEKVTAPVAADWGLISHLVPDGGFDAEVARLARQLAEGAPLAQAWTTRAVNDATLGDIERAFALEWQGQEVLLASEDFVEGTTAFQEKREARFRGR